MFQGKRPSSGRRPLLDHLPFISTSWGQQWEFSSTWPGPWRFGRLGGMSQQCAAYYLHVIPFCSASENAIPAHNSVFIPLRTAPFLGVPLRTAVFLAVPFRTMLFLHVIPFLSVQDLARQCIVLTRTNTELRTISLQGMVFGFT